MFSRWSIVAFVLEGLTRFMLIIFQNGDTPLHMAVYYSRDESVEALLLSKADVSVTNNVGNIFFI